MKVIEIVAAHLRANGFDGLVQQDAQCGCLLDDLAPCCDQIDSCEPGYRRPMTQEEKDNHGEPQRAADDWVVCIHKPEAP